MRLSWLMVERPTERKYLWGVISPSQSSQHLLPKPGETAAEQLFVAYPRSSSSYTQQRDYFQPLLHSPKPPHEQDVHSGSWLLQLARQTGLQRCLLPLLVSQVSCKWQRGTPIAFATNTIYIFRPTQNKLLIHVDHAYLVRFFALLL